MYAERKQWPLGAIHVALHYVKDGGQDRIERTLSFEGSLSEEQRARLAEIAERTPVTLALKSGVSILTTLK
jgi:putative redox protein